MMGPRVTALAMTGRRRPVGGPALFSCRNSTSAKVEQLLLELLVCGALGNRREAKPNWRERNKMEISL